MSYTEFFPFGIESVQVIFSCSKCGHEILSESISVPSPYFEAEEIRDSYNCNSDSITCENCGEEFIINVCSSYADGYIEIYDVTDEDVLEVIEHSKELDEYYEQQIDAILSNTSSYDLFTNEIKNIKRLNEIEIEDKELLKTLKRQLYCGVITCLEVYLSDILIKFVLGKDECFKQFVRTFHKFKNQKFDLNELYEKLDKIRDIVKEELLNVIYHDLSKVKGIYEDTFGIEFPDISDLSKAVSIRHDLIHRNGRTKEGKEVEINKAIVSDIISKAESFVNEIDQKIKVLYPTNGYE